jgi:hypothetical protein
MMGVNEAIILYLIFVFMISVVEMEGAKNRKSRLYACYVGIVWPLVMIGGVAVLILEFIEWVDGKANMVLERWA